MRSPPPAYPISSADARLSAAIKRKQQTLTLVAMCLALAITVLDDSVVNVALPSLQVSLAMPVSQLEWVINAYLLAIACLVLPTGTLGDIYGRRRVFLAGLSIFVVASVIVGMAVSGHIVIAARLLQGVGAAALLPSSLAILSETFVDPKERTKAIGLWSGVSGLALVVGPALGGVLVDTLGWRSIFFINVPLGLATFWLMQQILPAASRTTSRPSALPALRQTRQTISPQLDWPGMVLSAVAIAALIMLMMGADGLTGVGLGLLGTSCAIAFVVVESVSARPMLPLALFRRRAFVTAFVTNALLFFMLVSLLFLFSLFLQQVQGYSAIATGLRFLPLNGAFVVASIVSGYFSARIGQRYTITLGFVIAAVAVLSLIQIQPDTPYGAMVWKLTLVGFGVGFTLSPLTAAGMESLPAARSGMAAALMNTSTRLGGALGIAVLGGLFSSRMGRYLEQAISTIGLSADVRSAVISELLAYGTTRPDRLSSLLAQSAATFADATFADAAFADLELAAHQAFVLGLHSVALAAAIALFIAAGLSFTSHQQSNS